MESVWDYPRPPALVPCERRVRVEHAGVLVADSTRALRVLETSHPPTIYVPPEDVLTELLEAVGGSSFCEWKGSASYWDVVVDGSRAGRAAWSYARPQSPYEALVDHLSFYPGRVDACLLDEEHVETQAGDFYGGWITSDVTGPFKGAPHTLGW